MDLRYVVNDVAGSCRVLTYKYNQNSSGMSWWGAAPSLHVPNTAGHCELLCDSRNISLARIQNTPSDPRPAANGSRKWCHDSVEGLDGG